MRHRILILIDTQVVSGPAKGVLQLLRHADKSKFEFVIGAFSYRSPKSRDFIEVVNARGLPTAHLRQNFFLDPTSVFDAIRAFREQRCSIVESHGYKTHLIAALVKFWGLVRGRPVPWIAVSHGWTAENVKVKLYHLLDRALLRFADHAIVVAPDMEVALLKIVKNPKKVTMITNAIEQESELDGTARLRIRAELKISPATILVGCFGRMSREKGQTVLIEALALLPLVPRVELLFVGDGVDRVELEKLVTDRGLKERVRFVGYQRAIAPYYAAIDLLVIPSLSEGMPNVLLEAQSLGIPVLSSNVGGVGEAIKDGVSGWLVTPGNPTELADKMLRIVTHFDQVKKVGEAGRQSLYPKFDPAGRAEKIVGLYESVGENDLGTIPFKPTKH